MIKKSISKHQQNDIWYRKKTPNGDIIRLRRNHKQFEKETEEGKELFWECEEIEGFVPHKNNIQQYVEQNFDLLFEIFTKEVE
jgi:hypothetical protein